MAEIPGDLAQLYKEGRLNKAELALVLFRRGVFTDQQFKKVVETNKFFPVRAEALKAIGSTGMDILRLSGAGMVGARAALGGRSLGEVAERMIAARKQGFQPQKGEALPRFIGETLPISALTAGVAPIAGALAPAAGPTLRAALTGAGTMGLLSQLRQAGERGKISPARTALEAGLGGAISGAIPGAVPVAQAIGRGVKKVTPALLRQFPKITPEATETILREPSVLKRFAGTPESIEARVLSVMDTLRKARKNFGAAVGAFKKTLGIVKPEEEVLDDLLAGKMAVKPLGQMREELNILESLTKAPGNINQIKQRLLISRMRAGSESEKVAADTLLEKIDTWGNPKKRLESILELKGHANAHSSFTTKELAPVLGEKQYGLRLLRGKLDNLTKQYPGGEKLLRINDRFSKVAKVFDKLQAQLPRPGKAESKMERAFRAKSTTALLVNNKDFMNDMRELERLTGKKLLRPLFNELTASEFAPWLPRGGFPIGTTMAAGGAGAAFFTGHPLLGTAILAATSPKIAGKAITGAMRAGKLISPLARLMQKQAITTPAATSILERLMRENASNK